MIKSQPYAALIQRAFRHVHVSTGIEITMEFSFVGIQGRREAWIGSNRTVGGFESEALLARRVPKPLPALQEPPSLSKAVQSQVATRKMLLQIFPCPPPLIVSGRQRALWAVATGALPIRVSTAA